MRLPGRLSSTTLGDLLGLLHRERASGTLELIEVAGPTCGRAHKLCLDDGLVSGVQTTLGVPRLGDILRERGFLPDEALRRLGRELTRAPGRRAGDILVRDERLSPHVLSAALRRQLRHRLDALFDLKDAELRFRPARAKEERSIPLSPREFLHGRPRKRDKSAGPGAARAPAPTAGGRERARAEAFRVLGLVAGSSREAVQRAFRREAARLHPDRNLRASADQRAVLLKQFAELSAAYHLLVA
jgi:hypothetical protein